MTTQYLEIPIAETIQTETPHYGMARDGYTYLSGAPTSTMIRLKGERIWRRLMVWCFSNTQTLFIRKGEECLIVLGHDLTNND